MPKLVIKQNKGDDVVKLDHRTHIYKLSDTYIGSCEKAMEDKYILNSETKKFEKHSLEYIPGEYKIFDGETQFPRIIIVKFPSYEKALEWYNSEEYKPIKQIRLDNSEGTNIIIKGI